MLKGTGSSVEIWWHVHKGLGISGFRAPEILNPKPEILNPKS